jgi:uncharacterized protein (TIGR03435 family)
MTASGVNLRFLIQQAYGVRDFQIENAPDWAASDRYVVATKGEDGHNPSQAELREMLRGMLQDRFNLTFHRETKEGSVYLLGAAKGGPKLKETEGEARTQQQMRMGRGSIDAQGGSMELLCNQLGNQLGRPVLDRTGLKGLYDIKLEWTPDGGGPPQIRGTEEPKPDQGGPSVFTALQEQLGLKLDAGKGPVDFFVIDKVGKPTEN